MLKGKGHKCLKTSPDFLNYSTHRLLSGDNVSVITVVINQSFQNTSDMNKLRVVGPGWFCFAYRPLFKPYCFDI